MKYRRMYSVFGALICLASSLGSQLHAQPPPIPCIIWATAGEHGSISPSFEVQVPPGTDQKFLITPDPGYRIADVIVDGESVGAVAQYTFEDISSGSYHTIHAIFEIRRYNITASTGDHGRITPSGSMEVSYGSSQTFLIIPDSGYHIADVIVDGTPQIPPLATYTFTNITGDHTIHATFQINILIITATAGDNGRIIPSGSMEVFYGSSQTFLIIPDPGCHIADVIIDGIPQIPPPTAYTFTNVTTNHTIHVNFQINIYTIRAIAGEHGKITPSGEMGLPYGSNLTFSITPDPGYHIADVNVDGKSVGTVAEYQFKDIREDHTIYVTFEINRYTITATTEGNGGISPSGSIEVPHGSDLTFSITPDLGYHIADVSVDGKSVGIVSKYSFTDVKENHAIHATFEINLYIITATAEEHGKITPSGEIEVPYGYNLTILIMPDPGYHISGINVDGIAQTTLSTTYTFTNITADHTLHATFQINVYTITASAGDHGSITPSGELRVTYGSDQTFIITPAIGYHILDVKVDGESLGTLAEYTFSNVTVNHTIRATFEINRYTIVATTEGYGSIKPSGEVKINYGADQIFTITPDTNYHVADVLVDGKSVGTITNYAFKSVTSDHTIYVIFEIDRYKIIATAGDHGSITPSGEMVVNHGEDQIFAITPDANYHVADVLVDGKSMGAMTAYAFRDVKSDYTIHAIFEIDRYIITVTAGDYGSITPSDEVKVDHGSDQAFTITPLTGYHILDVLVDGVSVGAINIYTFSNVTVEHTISASFEINRYTITATAGDHGNISPSGEVRLDYGASKMFTIAPDTGYRIADVLVDGKSGGALTSHIFTVVTADHTIHAIFAINTYTITATAGTHGTITPSGKIRVNHGANQVFSITPDAGYHVANVNVDDRSVGAVTEYIFRDITTNHKIHATFEINRYTITATAGDHLTISPYGEVKVNHGADLTFTIAPNPGYSVVDVVVDGISVGAVTKYTFANVSSNHTLYATTGGIRGDVNGDGSVRADDAILVLRISAGLMDPTPKQKYAADMNNDGRIGANDAILILRKSAGMGAPSKNANRIITITLGEAYGMAGGNITISVNVDNIDVLAGGDLYLGYDNTVLSAVNVSSDPNVLLTSNISESGMVRIAFAKADRLSNKTIAKVRFDIIADDISPLVFKGVKLYSFDATPLNSVSVNGKFRSLAMPPEHNMLLQNFPNPSNPETWIPYQLKERSHVMIQIYSVSGELVRTLDMGYQPAGLYMSRDRAAYWDGKDRLGIPVANGVYFYGIRAGSFTAVRKLTILR